MYLDFFPVLNLKQTQLPVYFPEVPIDSYYKHGNIYIT